MVHAEVLKARELIGETALAPVADFGGSELSAEDEAELLEFAGRDALANAAPQRRPAVMAGSP